LTSSLLGGVGRDAAYVAGHISEADKSGIRTGRVISVD
jgi:uncharacterized protein with ACT and thioredoxin-like domain